MRSRVGRWTKPISFIRSKRVEAAEPESAIGALERCRERNLHFSDACRATAASEVGTTIASFDRDVDKLPDVKRIRLKG